ncbi:MAG: DUF2283 domain-containing protein [Thermodesulfobacteriota bacterium]
MAQVKIWYDKEGDYLEVTFSSAKGYFHEVCEDVFERVDEEGKLIGFAVFNFSRRDRTEVEIPLELSKLVV